MQFTSVHLGLPVTGRNVIAYNINTGEMEFGFRSEVDRDPENWIDFSFQVTHWMYCTHPESEEDNGTEIVLSGITFNVSRVDGAPDGSGMPERIVLERDGVTAEYLLTAAVDRECSVVQKATGRWRSQ